ncbi:HD superfamily hydrolase [Secundilactobacillus odoratitofui DSM 19909 = JCM 15043]|uniref:HD superfamily hydrolase n=1 Tax=Secundilactobacillus odoratitofui DSM 19909 = JCM 15043 TaxID=1423776 RepID=A0A0R1M4V8_9LACO|nr:HD superfamily hydrolase [Secundilactobacillus odoratitofui DSM 19909 = JCM 15043]
MSDLEATEQLAAINNYTAQKLAGDQTGHGLDHISRVVTNAKMLLAEEPSADYLITLTAAYLHDVIDDKLVDDVAAAQQAVEQFLTSLAFTSAQINTVMLIINNMSFSKSLTEDQQPLPLEGQIVQDADRLDAIGAIGITRAIYYGGHHSEKIYDPKVKPRQNMTKAEYRNLENETIINHFYEKLLKLADQMNTPVAKRIARGRQKTMTTFLENFKAEWNGMQ